MDLHGLPIEPLLGDLLGELGPSPFAIAVAQPDAATSGFRVSHVSSDPHGPNAVSCYSAFTIRSRILHSNILRGICGYLTPITWGVA